MISLVNHMNILVIEDEQLLSGSLRELLAQHGFAAEAAYDGPLGLELALTGVYDLIILDVMLPGMGGYEIARRLRSKRVGTPILMLTQMMIRDMKRTMTTKLIFKEKMFLIIFLQSINVNI